MSGSDDFTMHMWEPSVNKHSIARLTGHVQLINQVVRWVWRLASLRLLPLSGVGAAGAPSDVRVVRQST